MKTNVPIRIVAPRSFGFWSSLLRYYAVFIGVVTCFFVYGFLGLYVYFSSSTPGAPDFVQFEKTLEKTTLVYGSDGSLIGELGQEKRRWISLKDVPQGFIDALLLTEDRRFFDHGALDLRGLFRALWRNLQEGRLIQGGSSITQQVAKSFLSSDKSFERKIKELILSRRIFSHYKREEILEWYVNQAPFGHNTFGVSAASLFYFDRDISQMTQREDIPKWALLAGLVNAPTRFSPINNPQKALVRRNWVLSRMKENGYLTAQEYHNMESSPLALSIRGMIAKDRVPFFVELVRKKLPTLIGKERVDKGGLVVETTVSPLQSSLAHDSLAYGISSLEKRQGYRGPIARMPAYNRPKFIEKLREAYKNPLEEGTLYVGLVTAVSSQKATVHLGITTGTIPLENMAWASRFDEKDSTNNRTIESVTQALSLGDVVWVSLKKKTPRKPFSEVGYDEKGEPFWLPQKRIPPKLTNELELEQLPKVQGALYSVDYQTGYVLAYEGGVDFSRNEYDRIGMGCRLPGSAFKPIYYSLALNDGYSYETIWSDKKKLEVDEKTGKKQVLENIDNKYLQEVTLKHALVWSKNPPSQEIFNTLGAKSVAAWARRLGITTPLVVDKGLALGSSCVKINELTGAYSVFARMGRPLEPIEIKRIVDSRTGYVLYDKTAGNDLLGHAESRLRYFATQAGWQNKEVISPRTAYLTARLLRYVVTDGHSGLIRQIELPYALKNALKTGTSSNTSDVATYSFDYCRVIAIQIGTNDYTGRQLGYKEASFTIALPILGKYLAGTRGCVPPNAPLVPPPGVLANDIGGPLLPGKPLPPLEQAKQQAMLEKQSPVQ